MTFEQELIQILNQIPGVIERSFTAFVERHPGHSPQKVHGHRYGAGGDLLPKGHKRGDVVRGNKGKSSGSSADTDPKTWTKRLSKKEKDALVDYAGSEFSRLNSGLRGGKLSKKDQETVAALDSALAKSKLTKDTTLHADEKLYRAADIPAVNAAIRAGDLEGLEFTDKGFVSTTKDKDIARNFQRSEGSRLFIINAPKGTKAGDISSLGATFAKENETLLARDTKFKVSKVEKVKEKYQFRGPDGKMKTGTRTVEYIHMDVVGQG